MASQAAAAAAPAPPASEPLPGGVSAPSSGPYKFLDFYAEADEKSFAGREREVREVVARICTNRTFVLYAPSGLGKTSMLLAAVFPALRHRSFTPIYLRTVGAPLANLATALGAPGAATTSDDFTALLRARSRQTTTVLVFDQFEEFFIHLRQQPQERRDFARVIAALVGDSSLNVRVVFSLREDYLAELDELRDDMPDLLINDYRLRPLTAFGTRQAIVQPLIHADVAFDRRLLVKLVDLLADVRFDPVMLQILCTEVYRQAQSRHEHEAQPATDDDDIAPRLTETDLERVGGLDGVFRRYLDRVIANVPSNMLLLTRTVLDNLITQEQTKRAVTGETLVTADFSASAQEIDTVLAVLGRFRLVRSELRAGQVWYELSHERLVLAVLDWLKLDEDFYRFRVARDLVANNCRGEVWRGNFDALLNEGVLRDVLARYARRFRFTPTEREFVYKSAVYRCADTAVWEPLLAVEDRRAIVHMFLGHDSPLARIAGAKAAASLADSDGAFGSMCVDLALHAQEEPVRRAAGSALGVLATPTHLRAIRAALGASGTRRAATEVMVDLHRAGRDLSSFSIYRRLRAGAIARAERRRQHTEDIRLRGKAGAIAGLVAGSVWVFAVGIPSMIVAGWVGGYGLQLGELLLAAFWLIVIVPAGALFGWRIGRAGAAQAACDGREGRWFHALMRVTVLYALSIGVFVVIGGAFVIGLGPVVPLLVLASSLVYMLCVAGLSLLAKPHVLACRTTARMGAAILLFSFEVACLPLALVLVGMEIWPDVLAELDIPALSIGLWLSVGVAVSTGTLSATVPRAFRIKAMEARRTRALVLVRPVILCALVAGFFVVYRFDSLPFPFFERRLEVEPGKPVEVETNLRMGLSDSSYLRLASAEQPRWLRVLNIPRDVEVLVDDLEIDPSMLVHVPAGPHTLTLRGRVLHPGSERVAISTLPTELADGETEGLIAAVATRRPNANEWVGSLHGTIGRASAARILLTLVDLALVKDGDELAEVVVSGPAVRTDGLGATNGSKVKLRVGTELASEGGNTSDVATVGVSPTGTWSASFVLKLTPGVAKTAPDKLSTVFRAKKLTD